MGKGIIKVKLKRKKGQVLGLYQAPETGHMLSFKLLCDGQLSKSGSFLKTLQLLFLPSPQILRVL